LPAFLTTRLLRLRQGNLAEAAVNRLDRRHAKFCRLLQCPIPALTFEQGQSQGNVQGACGIALARRLDCQHGALALYPNQFGCMFPTIAREQGKALTASGAQYPQQVVACLGGEEQASIGRWCLEVEVNPWHTAIGACHDRQRKDDPSRGLVYALPMNGDGGIDSDWVAELLRESAARFLLPGFQRLTATRKPDGSIVTSADLHSQNFLQEALAQRYPDIPLLGEEMTAAEQADLMRTAGLLWCLDPLDGTSNYAAGVPVFGISLALLDGQGARQGWVYDPIRDELFTAVRGGGAFCNGERLPCREAPGLSGSVGVLDYKRLAPELAIALVTRQPFHSQRNFGSCVLEWSWLAAGRYHFYLHGAQQLWDWAAGGLLLQEAGGQLSTLAGEPLCPNALAKRSVLAALDPLLHAAWSTWLVTEFPKSRA